jgi:hypothetical protein
MFAKAIKEYGVPIEMLDRALAGEDIPDARGGGIDPTQLKQQITQEIFGQFQQYREQSNQKYGEQTVQQWLKEKTPEFFGDVREDMAVLMRTREGMTLDRAYEIACRMNDDVTAEVSKRKQGEELKRRQEVANRARAVSGSIRNEPPGPKAKDGEEEEDLRSTIRNSMRSDRL